MSNMYFYEQHQSDFTIRQGAALNFFAHLHRQVEFYLQLDGVQQMTVDGTTRTLFPGDAALVLPNRVHSYQAQGNGQHIIGIIDISEAGEYAKRFLSSECDDPFLDAGRVHPDVRHCCGMLAAAEGRMDPALRRAYLAVIFGRLTEEMSLKPAQQSSGRDMARSLLLYIAEHIEEPISLEMLSKRLYINKYSISRIFSEQIGCGLHTYVNALRVELAQNLLRGPTISTTELIARCGFESERTFYRTFREQCGMTPRQYRQQAAGEKKG